MKLVMNMIIVILLFSISACASNNVRTLGEGERDLGTWENTPIWFHSALYYPSEISLNFPGYIIGIEKSPKEAISQDGDVNTVIIPNAGKKIGKHIARIGEDDKLLYISHILENFGDQHGLDACVHYNAYYREDNPHTHIKFCQPHEAQEINPKKAYVGSWDALDLLKQDIHDKIQNHSYTHIVVGMMGWNTDQEEAIRNFNSVAKNVKVAAGEEVFRPLFLGITWPSKWAADWITPIITLYSYGNKADDADEIGFGWLGVLLHDTLRDLPKDVPIVVLGHSFGARVSSMGVCMGPAIVKKPGDSLLPRNTIPLLIGLQGAYSMNRYYENKGREGIFYPGSCENAQHVVLTSSKYDKAMDNKSYVPFVGNNTTYKDHCKKKSETESEFDCVKASSDGTVTLPSESQKRKTYINANELIFFNAYGSGGLAHSDIYRKEMGVMLWNVISAKVAN